MEADTAIFDPEGAKEIDLQSDQELTEERIWKNMDSFEVKLLSLISVKIRSRMVDVA